VYVAFFCSFWFLTFKLLNQHNSAGKRPFSITSYERKKKKKVYASDLNHTYIAAFWIQ
jgi:hypothetical protein